MMAGVFSGSISRMRENAMSLPTHLSAAPSPATSLSSFGVSSERAPDGEVAERRLQHDSATGPDAGPPTLAPLNVIAASHRTQAAGLTECWYALSGSGPSCSHLAWHLTRAVRRGAGRRTSS